VDLAAPVGFADFLYCATRRNARSSRISFNSMTPRFCLLCSQFGERDLRRPPDYNVWWAKRAPAEKVSASSISATCTNGDRVGSGGLPRLMHLGKENPLRCGGGSGCGITGIPAYEAELKILFALITTRLAVSVVNSVQRAMVKPDDYYGANQQRPAWEALAELAKIHPRFAQHTFREACGWRLPAKRRAEEWLAENAPGCLRAGHGPCARHRAWYLISAPEADFWALDPAAADPAIKAGGFLKR